MCCDGTLYTRAKVAECELTEVAGKRLELTTFEGKKYFRQPCPFESCGSCTIYEQRFAVCRSFECALLRRFNAGEVSSTEAHSMISTAKALRARVTAANPDDSGYARRFETRSRLDAAMTGLSAKRREKEARRLLNIIALDTFLDRWFRNKKDHADGDGADKGIC